MAKMVRSARGELIDIALLEMKSKLVNTQPSEAVVQRKAKIESKPVYYVEPEVEVVPEEAVQTGILNQSTRKRK
jgi:hypothetical protein